LSGRGESLSRVWLGAIFVVALVLRIVCVAQYEAHHPNANRPVIDEASYDAWAREIAGGEVVGKTIFFQEPLYPYCLGAVYAASGHDESTQRSVARYSQAVLGALTAVLSALLAAKLFSARAGIVAGLGVALHRTAIWFPTLLLKENVFLPLVVLLALLLVTTREVDERESATARRRWITWALVGVLAALGALLRGNLLVLLPCFVAWPVVRAVCERRAFARALGASLAVAAGTALVLAPVALRNYAVGGRFVLSTSGAGTNFYGGNNLDNPYGVATEFDWVRGIPEHEADDWRREASRRAGAELDATQTSAFWMNAALTSMREHPREHAVILANKLRLTLGRYEVPDNHFLEWDARFVPLLGLPLPGFEVWGLLALGGALLFALDFVRKRQPARARPAAFEVLVLAALYVATVVLTVTSERVRLVLVPLLLPFGGFAFDEVRALLDGPRRGRSLCLAFALAALAVFVPVLPAGEREKDFDERDYNLAVRLLREDDAERAAPLIEHLQGEHGGSASVQLLTAELEWRRARAVLDTLVGASRMPDATAKQVESALTRLSGIARRGDAKSRFRAQVLAGSIREYLGHWPQAESEYRVALAFDAEDRDVRRRLARVIGEQAMQDSNAARRADRLREAAAILERLLIERSEPEIESMLAKMRAQLDRGQ
jgi:4-amino-4-deoxy-L-arabinose transferase-like glycosyltransferase